MKSLCVSNASNMNQTLLFELNVGYIRYCMKSICTEPNNLSERTDRIDMNSGVAMANFCIPH